jgi:hypothetical protein
MIWFHFVSMIQYMIMLIGSRMERVWEKFTPLRQKYFGPRLSWSMRWRVEKEWKFEYPGLSLKHCPWRISSDGYEWYWQNGRWRPELPAVGGILHRASIGFDGVVHSETQEYTDEAGVRHIKRWQKRIPTIKYF